MGIQPVYRQSVA